MRSIQSHFDPILVDDDGIGRPLVTETAIQSVPVHEQDALRAIRDIVETLSPASLGALIALANGKLDDRDPRKIRLAEVKSLRRLASQAHALDSTMIEHAVDRRSLGEKRDDISPEAANTARWTDRLVLALEGIIRRYE
jgi:hypothetical protein